jgi:hypothetical protein
MAPYPMDVRTRAWRDSDAGIPTKDVAAAARPRHCDPVVDLVAIALHLVGPHACLNVVRHCGYRVATPL